MVKIEVEKIKSRKGCFKCGNPAEKIGKLYHYKVTKFKKVLDKNDKQSQNNNQFGQIISGKYNILITKIEDIEIKICNNCEIKLSFRNRLIGILLAAVFVGLSFLIYNHFSSLSIVFKAVTIAIDLGIVGLSIAMLIPNKKPEAEKDFMAYYKLTFEDKPLKKIEDLETCITSDEEILHNKLEKEYNINSQLYLAQTDMDSQPIFNHDFTNVLKDGSIEIKNAPFEYEKN